MSLDTNLQSALTRVGTEFKALRILISGLGTGDVSGLDTTATNLVDAINEVLGVAETGGDIAGAIHGATAKTTPVNADELGLVDSEAAFVLKRITVQNLANFVVALISDSAPATLDTLNELAAALGDDPNFATSMTTALAGKQAVDPTLTAIAAVTTAADKLIYATGADTFATTDLTAFARTLLDDANNGAARTTLDVWSKAEVGSVTTDYVAVFEAALT